LRLIVNRLYPPAPHSLVFDIALLALSLTFSIICGAILYLFVEKPLSWSKKKARPSNEVPLRQVPEAEEVSRLGV
jgi:peptidoglycan/LPS O-acetylase OafA/YrhL